MNRRNERSYVKTSVRGQHRVNRSYGYYSTNTLSMRKEGVQVLQSRKMNQCAYKLRDPLELSPTKPCQGPNNEVLNAFGVDLGRHMRKPAYVGVGSVGSHALYTQFSTNFPEKIFRNSCFGAVSLMIAKAPVTCGQIKQKQRRRKLLRILRSSIMS